MHGGKVLVGFSDSSIKIVWLALIIYTFLVMAICRGGGGMPFLAVPHVTMYLGPLLPIQPLSYKLEGTSL